MMRRNQPQEDLEEQHVIQRNTNCKVLSMGMLKQKKASSMVRAEGAVQYKMRAEIES